jgi:hypothetical protein
VPAEADSKQDWNSSHLAAFSDSDGAFLLAAFFFVDGAFWL